MMRFYRRERLLPDNVTNYFEPFFGGGAMFLTVMTERSPKNVVVNDINASIVSIYRAVRDDKDAFIREASLLESVYLPLQYEDRKKYYYDLRHQHAYEYEEWSPTRESAVLFFLMKTGFNGLWQINKNTNGRFGTPCGLLKQSATVFDRDQINGWHDILQGVTINCGDWRKSVFEKPNSFYFLDPPYRGSVTSYGQVFSDEDQSDLIDFAKSVTPPSRVILCNDDIGDGFFEERKGHLETVSFDIKHTAGRRKKTKDGFEAKSVTEIALHNASHRLSAFDDLFETLCER